MSSTIKDFADLYTFLLGKKCTLELSDRERIVQRSLLKKATIGNRFTFLLESPNLLALIDSVERLVSIIQTVPDYVAGQLIVKKSELITTLDHLTTLKKKHPDLTEEFMCEKATQVDIRDDLDIQAIIPTYSFLVKPLLQRKANFEKVQNVMTYLKIVEIEPALAESLLDNQALRNDIKEFTEIHMILEEQPTCAAKLFQDERIRDMVKDPFMLQMLMRLSFDIVRSLFQHESAREKFKEIDVQFSLFCGIEDEKEDEKISKLLTCFYGDRQLSTDIVRQFENIQLERVWEENGSKVLEIVRKHGTGCSDQKTKQFRR